VEQAFSTDVAYYEGRAAGIASVAGSTVEEARDELAARHGFAGWTALVGYVEALRDGRESPSSFMLAYRAVEAGDTDVLRGLLDRDPGLVRARGTNGNDLLGLAGGNQALVRLLLERGADANRGNHYGWTILHQAAYSNDRALARVALDAGADPSGSARGDGGTPLVVALFWGHREVVSDLGEAPRNLRVAAGRRASSCPRPPPGAFRPSLAGPPARRDGAPSLPRRAPGRQRCRGRSGRHRAHLLRVVGRRPGRKAAVRPMKRPVCCRGRRPHELVHQIDPPESLHDGTPSGWASFGGHAELAEVLRLSA
jgi:ankyrin repeat protein